MNVFCCQPFHSAVAQSTFWCQLSRLCHLPMNSQYVESATRRRWYEKWFANKSFFRLVNSTSVSIKYTIYESLPADDATANKNVSVTAQGSLGILDQAASLSLSRSEVTLSSAETTDKDSLGRNRRDRCVASGVLHSGCKMMAQVVAPSVEIILDINDDDRTILKRILFRIATAHSNPVTARHHQLLEPLR